MERKELINKLVKDYFDIEGAWDEKIFEVNTSKYGFLTPIYSITYEDKFNELLITSSPITSTEWWQTLLPVEMCPRFKGKEIIIPDEFDKFCKQGKCTVCGASDGFVELRAARFRMNEEDEIITKRFPRLKKFIERAYRIIDEINETQETELLLDTTSNYPQIFASISYDESIIQKYFEAFKTAYREITGIFGQIDVAVIEQTGDFEDSTEEEDLVQEARTYALREAVRMEAYTSLRNLMKNKNGSIVGNEYIIESMKVRYVMYPTRIEGYNNNLYAGSVTFEKGSNEVKDFLVTILGGGRWS